jgi:hypothetical protein
LPNFKYVLFGAEVHLSDKYFLWTEVLSTEKEVNFSENPLSIRAVKNG